MKSIEEIKNIIAEHRGALQSQHKVKQIGVFGSYVRGEQKKKSDLDILVSFSGSVNLVEFIQLENDLSKLLGVKVDLVTKRALKPYIGRRILEEVIYV